MRQLPSRRSVLMPGSSTTLEVDSPDDGQPAPVAPAFIPQGTSAEMLAPSFDDENLARHLPPQTSSDDARILLTAAPTAAFEAFDDEEAAGEPAGPNGGSPARREVSEALTQAISLGYGDLDDFDPPAPAEPGAATAPLPRPAFRPVPADAEETMAVRPSSTVRQGPFAANPNRTVHIAPGATLRHASTSQIQALYQPGEDQPDFVLGNLIGKGGQGEVWEAWQTSLQRLVAVKCLRSGDLGEFLQEAYTSGELDHPNIVPVYDLGRMLQEGEERPLLAMKLVQGTPWNVALEEDRALRDRQPEVFLTKHLRVLVDVCNAVAYAHSKGIIHRDLKPSQVMLGGFGEVYLMDWGLAVSINEEVPVVSNARSLPKHSTLRTASNRCGSPAYMAPEQTLDTAHQLGFHTDIYLLGAILFEIVAGRPPHAAETAEGAYFMAVLNEVGELPGSCPDDLARLISRSLSSDPSERPESAVKFRDVLEDYISGAGRQRESREITELVENELRFTPVEHLDYGRVTQFSQRLARALQLWADNHHAEAVRQQILQRHARLALEAGDLQLAYSLAGSIGDDEERADLLRGIEIERQRKRDAESHRRLMTYSSLALAFLVLSASTIFFIRDARIRAEKAERDAEIAREAGRLSLYISRLDSISQNQAELVERVTELQFAEAELARRLSGALALPEAIRPRVAAPAPSNSEVAAWRQMLADRETLRLRRVELQEAGAVLTREPVELALAEAKFRLRTASNPADHLEAYRLFLEAQPLVPDLPEPHFGMGIAAGRANEWTSATLHLEQAATATRLIHGDRALEYAMALALQAEALGHAPPGEGGRRDTRRRELEQQAVEIMNPQLERLTRLLSERHRALGNAESASFFENLQPPAAAARP